MHDTALAIGRAAMEFYWRRPGGLIVELGSYDVNGSLRPHAPADAHYVGLDMEAGPSVDVVVSPSMRLPLRDDVADLILTSSAFEHDAFFWDTFLELMRVLKPGGFLYLSAPSNGTYHRHPTDQWRFYPDAGKCLETWGRHRGIPTSLVESFIADRQGDVWNDFVAVFAKSDAVSEDVGPLLCEAFPCRNVWKPGAADPAMVRNKTEDMELVAERQALQLDNDRLREQLIGLEASRAAAVRQAAQLDRSLEAIRSSRVWRLTQGLMRFARRPEPYA
jgi:SAM-dependent methyltransferase